MRNGIILASVACVVLAAASALAGPADISDADLKKAVQFCDTKLANVPVRQYQPGFEDCSAIDVEHRKRESERLTKEKATEDAKHFQGIVDRMKK